MDPVDFSTTTYHPTIHGAINALDEIQRNTIAARLCRNNQFVGDAKMFIIRDGQLAHMRFSALPGADDTYKLFRGGQEVEANAQQYRHFRTVLGLADEATHALIAETLINEFPTVFMDFSLAELMPGTRHPKAPSDERAHLQDPTTQLLAGMTKMIYPKEIMNSGADAQTARETYQLAERAITPGKGVIMATLKLANQSWIKDYLGHLVHHVRGQHARYLLERSRAHPTAVRAQRHPFSKSSLRELHRLSTEEPDRCSALVVQDYVHCIGSYRQQPVCTPTLGPLGQPDQGSSGSHGAASHSPSRKYRPTQAPQGRTCFISQEGTGKVLKRPDSSGRPLHPLQQRHPARRSQLPIPARETGRSSEEAEAGRKSQGASQCFNSCIQSKRFCSQAKRRTQSK